MKPAIRALIVSGLLLALGLVPAANDASDFPNRLIKIIVPSSAGGIIDLRARQIANRLSKNIGQPVIVDNRPGASGIMGADLVAKARPDGYTILMVGGGPFVITPALTRSLPFDPAKDFVPITQYSATPLVLLVHPLLGVNTVRELIALAKAKPGQLNYASPGMGSMTSVASEAFKHVANIDMVPVQYKGDAPALADVLAGHVPIIFNSAATSGEFIRQGKLRALMQTGTKRLKVLPDVPTASEVGLPGAALTGWGGLWAPARTPKQIVSHLNRELVKVIRSEEYKKIVEDSGAEAHANSPEEFAAFIESERVKWANIIKKAGVKWEQ